MTLLAQMLFEAQVGGKPQAYDLGSLFEIFWELGLY